MSQSFQSLPVAFAKSLEQPSDVALIDSVNHGFGRGRVFRHPFLNALVFIVVVKLLQQPFGKPTGLSV